MPETNGNGNTNQSALLYDPLPKRVGVVYSEAKREYFPTEAQFLTEAGAEKDARVIASYLEKMGMETFLFTGDDTLSENLKAKKPDMVFQLVDSVKGNEYLSSCIPGLLELLNIPYTGSDVLGLALCYNKYLVKQLIKAAGIPVPNCQLFLSANDQLDINLRFPLISKLNEIHGAVEINKDSISESEKALRERLKFLVSTYKQPVLVEEFIVGREITALVLEGQNKKVYMAEKKFEKAENKYQIASFDFQWLDNDPDNSWHYEKYTNDTLKELVRKAFEATKMMDYGKFDIRVDDSGRYYFIDANPNPAFGPKELETALGTILETMYKIDFKEVLRRLIINTYKGPIEDYNGTE